MLESLHYRDVHSVHRHWRTHTHTHTYTRWPREIAELHVFPFLFGPQPSVKGFWGNSDDDGVSRQRWQQFRTVQFSMSQEADTQMWTHTHQGGIYAWKDILDAHIESLKGAANWAVSVKFYKETSVKQKIVTSTWFCHFKVHLQSLTQDKEYNLDLFFSKMPCWLHVNVISTHNN